MIARTNPTCHTPVAEVSNAVIQRRLTAAELRIALMRQHCRDSTAGQRLLTASELRDAFAKRSRGRR